MRPGLAFVPWLSSRSYHLQLQSNVRSSKSCRNVYRYQLPTSLRTSEPPPHSSLSTALTVTPEPTVTGTSSSRREFLTSIMAEAAALGSADSHSNGNDNGNADPPTPETGAAQLFANGKRPNLLFIITDQERSMQHWPEDFVSKHLPNLDRLQRNGLTFQQGFCNACMCSPSRASLLTSQFPAKTGVTMTGSPQPRRSLPRSTPNLATYLTDYHCEWHGKWHLGNHPRDYGFHGWQPPDAGTSLSLNETLGGGTPDNDGRFLTEIKDFLKHYQATGGRPKKDKDGSDEDDDSTAKEEDTTTATAAIEKEDEGAEPQPFCLVASFVNPHDVYVAQYDPTLGYTTEDFQKIQVPLPSNYIEDLRANHKPRCQGDMGWPYVPFDNSPQEYVNFYAHLHTVVDAQIGQVLDTLEDCGLTDSTLIIRTADHGEQALSHTLVEKFYNAYEESMRVPYIISNPIAFPQRYATQALASHVDVLPTLLSLLQHKETTDCVGVPLTALWNDPELAASITRTKRNKATQPAIHFTYDDIPSRSGPSIIRCLRTPRYKYAVYFSSRGTDADWELYDLQKDPLEDRNLAGMETYAALQESLDRQLVVHMMHKETMPKHFDWPPRATSQSVGTVRSAAEHAKTKGNGDLPELPIDEIMEYRRYMSMQRLKRRHSSDSSSSGGPISKEDVPQDEHVL